MQIRFGTQTRLVNAKVRNPLKELIKTVVSLKPLRFLQVPRHAPNSP